MSMMLQSGRFGGGSPPSPAFADTAFLASGNGADGATSFTDESSHARVLTFSGGAQIDTGIVPSFGTGWFLFDGGGDFIKAASGPGFAPAGPLVIEGRIYSNMSAASQFVLGQWGAAGNRSWWVERFFNNLRLRFSTDGTNSVATYTLDNFPTNTEAYFRFERDASNNWRGWRDSTRIFTTAGSGALFASSEPISMGRGNAVNDPGSDYGGSLREIRLSAGSTNVHGSDTGFTAPTSPFPRS